MDYSSISLQEIDTNNIGSDIKAINNYGIEILLSKLKSHWINKDNEEIYCDFSFKNFNEGINFINSVAEQSEIHNHHPEIIVKYKNVRIVLTTHDVKGLSIKDFILASRIENIFIEKFT